MTEPTRDILPIYSRARAFHLETIEPIHTGASDHSNQPLCYIHPRSGKLDGETRSTTTRARARRLCSATRPTPLKTKPPSSDARCNFNTHYMKIARDCAARSFQLRVAAKSLFGAPSGVLRAFMKGYVESRGPHGAGAMIHRASPTTAHTVAKSLRRGPINVSDLGGTHQVIRTWPIGPFAICPQPLWTRRK